MINLSTNRKGTTYIAKMQKSDFAPRIREFNAKNFTFAVFV